MGAVSNRLVDAQATLSAFNSAGNWSSDDLSISIDTTSELWPDSSYKQYALQIPLNGVSGAIELTSAEILLGDLTHPIVSTFGVKMPSGGTVEITLSHSGSGGENSSFTTKNLRGSTSVINAPGVLNPQWNIIRSSPITPISNIGTVGMSIYVTFIPTNPAEVIYFTLPVLCQNFEFASNNKIVPNVMALMPEVFRLIDFEQDGDLELPFYRLMDVFTNGLDSAYQELASFAYLDNVDGYNDNIDATKSHLVNQDVADFLTLVWLCKFNGTKPVTRYESSLDTVTTPFELGDNVSTGSELGGDDGLLLTSYSELNPPVVNAAFQKELLRWQLDYGYYGTNAGTLPAVIEAAKRQLVGDKSIYYNYDFETEPWVINLETEWFETYGATGEEEIGNSSKLILSAVEYARPLGVKITHTMTSDVP